MLEQIVVVVDWVSHHSAEYKTLGAHLRIGLKSVECWLKVLLGGFVKLSAGLISVLVVTGLYLGKHAFELGI